MKIEISDIDQNTKEGLLLIQSLRTMVSFNLFKDIMPSLNWEQKNQFVLNQISMIAFQNFPDKFKIVTSQLSTKEFTDTVKTRIEEIEKEFEEIRQVNENLKKENQQLKNTLADLQAGIPAINPDLLKSGADYEKEIELKVIELTDCHKLIDSLKDDVIREKSAVKGWQNKAQEFAENCDKLERDKQTLIIARDQYCSLYLEVKNKISAWESIAESMKEVVTELKKSNEPVLVEAKQPEIKLGGVAIEPDKLNGDWSQYTQPKGFYSELRELLNRYSKESVSNTPDFILAEFVQNCLNSFNAATNQRTEFYSASKDKNK